MFFPSVLLAIVLPNLAFALPSSSSHPQRSLSTLLARQASISASVPEQCVYICNGISSALASCPNTTCLCNESILDSFLNCSECTLQATNPSNVNASIASYQSSIEAYRQTCLSTSPPIILPNVTVTVPSSNTTYPTSSNSTSSSSLSSVSASRSASSTLSSASVSSASASSSSTSAAAVATSTSASSTNTASFPFSSGNGASATASAGSTSAGEKQMGGSWTSLGTVMASAGFVGMVALTMV